MSYHPDTCSGTTKDDLYGKAVQIVTVTRDARISHLQRRLLIGYNRAARLLETMEAEGVVSRPSREGMRDVLQPNA